MSALRFSTPAGVTFLDLGPAVGGTATHVGGHRCVPEPARPERAVREPLSPAARRAQWQRDKARQRERDRRLNDAAWIGTEEGQRWLAELNARRDRDRRMRP